MEGAAVNLDGSGSGSDEWEDVDDACVCLGCLGVVLRSFEADFGGFEPGFG
jgi:hypothetical protein